MKQYLKEVNKKFKYRPTWVPGKPLKIGDIGILEKGVFSHRGTLDEKGIPFTVRIDESDSDMSYSSEGGVTIAAKLAGKASMPESQLAEGDAGLTISFSKEKATVFKLNGTKTSIITNAGAVGQEILNRYIQNNWEKDWVVITELIEANSATILVSNSKESKVELKAKANVQASEDLDIADAGLGLSIVGKKDLAVEIVAKDGITPLFRAAGIKKKLFGSEKFVARSILGDEVFAEINMTDEEFEGIDD